MIYFGTQRITDAQPRGFVTVVYEQHHEPRGLKADPI